jgi:Beta xylosidase C-terminal Concanavalin A-like domain
VLRFGVEDADAHIGVLAKLDGRYLSTEVVGGFTGLVIGMCAASDTVRFDWFDYQPVQATPRREPVAADTGWEARWGAAISCAPRPPASRRSVMTRCPNATLTG